MNGWRAILNRTRLVAFRIAGAWAALFVIVGVVSKASANELGSENSATLVATTADRAIPTEDVKVLVSELGSDLYSVRESATKQLIQKGIGSQAELVAAVDSSDAEVRLRARHVLDVIVAADRKQRLQNFRADVDGKLQTTLPGWAAFQKLAGSDRTAREMFFEMTQADSALLEAFEKGPKEAAKILQQRCTQPTAQPAPNRAGARQSGMLNMSDGSIMSLLFVAGQPKVPLTDEVIETMIALPRYPAFFNFKNPSPGDPRRELCLKILSQWVAKDVGSKQLPANLALAVQFNLKDGLAPAIKAIQQPQTSAVAKCNALKLVGKFGGQEQIPLVEPLLRDTQPCFDSGGSNQPTQAQIRDFALVATIRLNGQDPKQFGLAGVDWVSGADINPNLIAFKSERDRSAAFLAWQDWQKGQNQAARSKATEKPSRD